jgi:hypothetical protein
MQSWWRPAVFSLAAFSILGTVLRLAGGWTWLSIGALVLFGTAVVAVVIKLYLAAFSDEP